MRAAVPGRRSGGGGLSAARSESMFPRSPAVETRHARHVSTVRWPSTSSAPCASRSGGARPPSPAPPSAPIWSSAAPASPWPRPIMTSRRPPPPPPAAPPPPPRRRWCLRRRRCGRDGPAAAVACERNRQLGVARSRPADGRRPQRRLARHRRRTPAAYRRARAPARATAAAASCTSACWVRCSQRCVHLRHRIAGVRRAAARWRSSGGQRGPRVVMHAQPPMHGLIRRRRLAGWRGGPAERAPLPEGSRPIERQRRSAEPGRENADTSRHGSGRAQWRRGARTCTRRLRIYGGIAPRSGLLVRRCRPRVGIVQALGGCFCILAAPRRVAAESRVAAE